MIGYNPRKLMTIESYSYSLKNIHAMICLAYHRKLAKSPSDQPQYHSLRQIIHANGESYLNRVKVHEQHPQFLLINFRIPLFYLIHSCLLHHIIYKLVFLKVEFHFIVLKDESKIFNFHKFLFVFFRFYLELILKNFIINSFGNFF